MKPISKKQRSIEKKKTGKKLRPTGKKISTSQQRVFLLDKEKLGPLRRR